VLTGVARIVMLAGALALGGCAEVDRAYQAVSSAVHSALYEPRHQTPTRLTHASSPSSVGNYNATSAQRTSVSQTAPVVVDGLSAKAARALLGQPAAHGGPAPGETWTYRSGSCEVELFLFPNVTHGEMQVLDHRVSGAGTEQACLRRLRDGQNG
jgi:hypothetical protein